MLLYIEGLDRSGKSTFVRELSVETGVSIYRKLPPVALQVSDHHSYFKGVGFALAELHNIFNFNAIVDRSFVSDWVYTNRSSITKPISIWQEWENRHKDPQSAIIIFVDTPAKIIEERLTISADPYMKPAEISKFQSLYDDYFQQTRFRVVRVNGNAAYHQRATDLKTIGQLFLSN